MSGQREIVIVGRDGVSLPMRRYSDELHLPDSQRAIPPLPWRDMGLPELRQRCEHHGQAEACAELDRRGVEPPAIDVVDDIVTGHEKFFDSDFVEALRDSMAELYPAVMVGHDGMETLLAGLDRSPDENGGGASVLVAVRIGADVARVMRPDETGVVWAGRPFSQLSLEERAKLVVHEAYEAYASGHGGDVPF